MNAAPSLPRFGRLLCIFAIVAAFAATSWGEGADKDSSKPSDTGAAKRNPLLDDEPLVGVFKGPTLVVQIRLAKDGSFEGSIQKGGATFPMKAKRAGTALAGAFSHGEDHFPFTATLEGNVLHFTTGDRLFKLQRDGAAAVVPMPDPVPSVPKPADPVKPSVPVAPDPQPTTPKPVPAPGSQALPPRAANDLNKAWAGFPSGAFVIMDDVSARADKLPVARRLKLVFMGVEDGKEIVQAMRSAGEEWETRKPIAWMGGSKSAADLGFIAGKTTSEVLEVAQEAVVCEVTEYSREEVKDGKSGISRIQIWRSKAVSLPPQTLMLPTDNLLLESGVVRVTNTGDIWFKRTIDFRLTLTKQSHRIGNQDIRYAVFRLTEASDTFEGKQFLQQERWISSDVPGGVVKIAQEKRTGEGAISSLVSSAVDIGIWKPAAAPSKDAK